MCYFLKIVKICDFGLARALSENERLYIMNELKKVPFSWLVFGINTLK